MAEYDTNKHIFRDDLVPESNEQCSVGTPARRFKNIRAKTVIADTFTGTNIPTLTLTDVPFQGATQLVDDPGFFFYILATHALSVPELDVSTIKLDVTNKDVILSRDAANVLALRRAGSAQTLRVYGQDDGAGNTEYAVMFKVAANGQVRVGSAAAGTGGARGTSIGFGNTAESSWSSVADFDGNGVTVHSALLLTPDNSIDIGQSGALRPRDLFVGRDVNVTRDIIHTGTPLNLQHGRLTFVSGTQIKFGPFNGTKLPVVTSGVMRLRDIGSGITSGSPASAVNFVNGAASQTLAASTTYLVTVFDNAGTLTFDFLTTLTHTQDATTGVEIKNGDNTRTVVGMIRTNATPNFVQGSSQPWVRTWFNDPGIGAVANYTANRTTTSGSYAELNSEIRNEPLVWAGEVLVAHINGSQVNVDGAVIGQHSFNFDGVGGAENTFSATYTDATATRGGIAVALVKTGLAEGYHYVTHIAAKVGGGGTTLSCNGGGGNGNQTVLQTYIHK
jgi:hypothetical protein